MGQAKRRKQMDPNYGQPREVSTEGLVALATLTPETQADLANKAYYLTFGFMPPMPYEPDDDCEMMIRAHLGQIDEALNIHPLKKLSMPERYAKLGLLYTLN